MTLIQLHSGAAPPGESVQRLKTFPNEEGLRACRLVDISHTILGQTQTPYVPTLSEANAVAHGRQLSAELMCSVTTLAHIYIGEFEIYWVKK